MKTLTPFFALRTLLSAGLLVVACIGAALLWRIRPDFVAYTWKHNQVFELFGFTQTLALAAIALLWTPFCRQDRERWIPLAAFACLGLYYLSLFQSISTPTYDYRCWMNGMISHLQYGHPYSLEHTPSFWYPPLMAQMLAWGHESIASFYPGFVINTGRGGLVYQLLFYSYQCVQYLLLLGTYWLVYFFGRRLSLSRTWAAGAAFLLLVANTPLFRLLVFQQPNLWLLVSILVVLLYWDRSAWLTGLAMAVGFHVKLYPAVLGLPLLITRRWKALVWAAVFTLAIFVWQTNGLSNVSLWTNFLEQIVQPRWGSFYRDNSLHCVVKNGLDLFGLAQYDVLPTRLLTLAAVVGMLTRIFLRERRWLALFPASLSTSSWPARARFGEQAIDTLTMSFFMSPIVFEHHFVMAVPIILWTLRYHLARAPRRCLLGAILILWIPIYDVFPFAWNRLAGLLLLLAARPISILPDEPAWPPQRPALSAQPKE